jgi:uncharacterized membrane protein YhiD involved in acid resistance
MVLRSYFTEITVAKLSFYAVSILYVSSVSVVVSLEPFLSLPCSTSSTQGVTEHLNPDYAVSSCHHTRYARLLLLTPFECDLGRRLLISLFLGSVIGWERRQENRPAGIRTMALVALGSSLFTICSTFAFLSGPMEWDSSRISAAIPSGVGFLGAGLIFKQAQKDSALPSQVVGLTTATSLWLAAAVGVACGGQMYLVAMYTVSISMVLLRFGPRALHVSQELDRVESTQKLFRPSISIAGSARQRPPPSISDVV